MNPDTILTTLHGIYVVLLVALTADACFVVWLTTGQRRVRRSR